MQLPANLALDDFVKRFRGYDPDDSYQDLPDERFHIPLEVLFASFSALPEAFPHLNEAWNHTHSMLEAHKQQNLELSAAEKAATLSSCGHLFETIQALLDHLAN